MPEEKKESFTFSDKIKNSKPAGSKSFAKSSSKIGRDGKPRQTLFERTRRDAPFFIAALVALLLLPFLYKYSGQSSEDTTLVTPGSEETMFDPERYGFDSSTLMEDPDGQIAQLSGRSSLDLIKGWGSSEEDYADRDDMDFDSSAESSAEASATGEYEAEGRYDAEHRARTDIDEEENITNIYKRRARKATRAAFRRTQIGKLDPTSMRRGGGSRLGVNPWGGSLKNAAKKVGDEGPRKPTKPVSLQPLRAAGPARSSFGQGAAAAARKGLDNMGKADAKEALRDSYVKPVGPTRTGGIDLFADGRTGGSGKLDHNINIGKGQTPWWWDMMKTRMQKEWEARFNRKWDWIKFADKLAQNILKGLINCIITGNSDGDPDNFLGAVGANSTVEPTCCGKGAGSIGAVIEKQTGKAFGKEGCKNYQTDLQKQWEANGKQGEKPCQEGWKAASGGGGDVGFFRQRICCLGLCGNAYGSGELGLHAGGGALDCEEMPYHYTVVPTGQARKWNIYTYVVARNYFPESLKKKFPALPTTRKNLLCASMDKKHGGTGLAHYQASAGVGHVTTAEGGEYKDKARGTIIKQIRSTNNVSSRQQEIRENILEVDQESLADACVLVVARGNTISYEGIKNQIIDLFMALGKDKNVTNKEAEEAFYQLDLMLVSSFAVKDKLSFDYILGNAHKLKGMLPMPYWEFENAYINHKGVTNKQGQYTAHTVYDKKWRVEGTDLERGPICYFEDMKFECGPEDAATAKLVINSRSFRGGQWVNNPQKETPDGIEVSARFSYLAGDKHPVTQPMIAPKKSADGYSYTYTMDRIYDDTSVTRTGDAVELNIGGEGAGKGGLVGNIEWVAKRGEHEIRQRCPLNLSGDLVTPNGEDKGCKNSQQSEECCREIMTRAGKVEGEDFVWDPTKPVGSQCSSIDPCENNPQKSKECCEKLKGSQGYVWYEDQEPHCWRKVGPAPDPFVPGCDNNPEKSKECCEKLKGSEGYLWRESPEPHCYKGPNPKPPTSNQTRLAPVLSWIPYAGKTGCREDAGDDVNPSKGVFSKCEKVPGIKEGVRNNCGEQTPMTMDSEAAAKFVREVVAAYNKALPAGEKPLSDKFFDGVYPTDGEFVDALFLADKNSSIPGMPKTVAASAVCELGRDFFRMSRDKHTKEMKVDNPMTTPYPTDGRWKDSNMVFHNELGSFLAYVHVESIFYPQKYMGSRNQCDYRFMAVNEGDCIPRVNWKNETCIYASGERCKEYHHRNYNAIPPSGGQAIKVPNSKLVAYEDTLAPIQKKAVFPLADLVSGKTFPALGNSGGISKGKTYITNITGLLRENDGFQAWQGNACVAYTGTGSTLQIKDVLNYVETACSVGLDFKPYGRPGKQGGNTRTTDGNTHNVTGQGNTKGR